MSKSRKAMLAAMGGGDDDEDVKKVSKKGRRAAAAAAAADADEDAPAPEEAEAAGGEDGEAAAGGAKLTRKQRKEQERLAEIRERDEAELKARMAVQVGLTGEDDGEDYDEMFEKTKGSASHSDDVHLDDITIAFGAKRVLTGATLSLHRARRYALVGPNGTGKTTLLRHMARRRGPCANIPAHFDILYVEQEVAASDDTALASVMAADVLRTKLLEAEQRILNGDEDDPDGTRLGIISDKLDAIEAYSAEARACAILSGLGFSDADMKRPVHEFSGGWRMRIALARALFCRPTMLLLDEPTNHLDLHAVVWLTTYLRRWGRILVVVSHDQAFINDVCTDIVYIHNEKLHYFRGDYNGFREQVAQRRREDMADYERAKKLEKRDAAHQHDRKARAGTAKERRAEEDKIKQRERERKARRGGGDSDDDKPAKGGPKRPEKEYEGMVFLFPDPERLSPSFPVIAVHGASFGYPDREPLFTDLEFGFGLDSKVALVGPNGAGKTTLINLMKGVLRPTAGEVTIHRKLVIGEFTQHFVERLDPADTAIGHILKVCEGAEGVDEKFVWKRLAGMGLTGKTPTQAIGTLSGGQKSRVVFTELCMRNPHILMLDEPTNHLDIESIDALSEALEEFRGGLILVSHDVRLISKVCSEVWVVGDGTATLYDGSFEVYRRRLMDKYEEEEEAREAARVALEAERKAKREAERSAKVAKATSNRARKKAAAAAAAPAAPPAAAAEAPPAPAAAADE